MPWPIIIGAVGAVGAVGGVAYAIRKAFWVKCPDCERHFLPEDEDKCTECGNHFCPEHLEKVEVYCDEFGKPMNPGSYCSEHIHIGKQLQKELECLIDEAREVEVYPSTYKGRTGPLKFNERIETEYCYSRGEAEFALKMFAANRGVKLIVKREFDTSSCSDEENPNWVRTTFRAVGWI